MTFWEVSFIAWACAGDFGLIGLSIKAIPDSARPAAAALGICRPEVQIERIASRNHAERRIKEIGPGARLRFCKGLKCWDKKISWKTTVDFE